MKITYASILMFIDWVFFALFIISIYFLIVTNYNGFNLAAFIEYGSLVIIFFFLFYYFGKITWAVKEKTRAGPESLIGKVGVVTKELNPVGEVKIEGIIWRARSLTNENIETGQYIIVKKIENITLVVEKVNR